MPKEKKTGDVVQNKMPAAAPDQVEKSEDDKDKAKEAPFSGANVVNAGKT